MVDVEFTADVFVCMVRITNPRYDPRGCVYIGFQTHMQMTLICGKAPVDNAVPMQTAMDAKAVKEIFCLTGTAGFICCGSCQNVISEPYDNPRLVHYTCDDPAKFVKQTHASFIEICDAVQRAAGEMHKHELAKLQKYCGISWQAGGFAFDAYARELSDIPRLMFWDHMHTLSASGGIGQFTLNGCAVKIARSGWHLKTLDQMMTTVKLPKCWGTLHPRFFQDRIDWPGRGKPCEGHVKAFSSEVLLATRALSLIFRELLNAGQFTLLGDEATEYCEMLDTLRQVYDLFLIGDRLVHHTEMLHSLLLKHHKLYCKLLPLCVKPKLHLALHLAECVKEHGYNVSAAAGERSISIPKTAGAGSFRNFHHSLTGVAWQKFLPKLANSWFGVPQYLPKKWHSVNVANAHEATAAVSIHGLLSADDLVFWRVGGFHVGFITSFIQYDTTGEIYAAIRPLVRTPRNVAWRKLDDTATLSVEISCLRTLVYTMDEDGTCAILFPPA